MFFLFLPRKHLDRREEYAPDGLLSNSDANVLQEEERVEGGGWDND